MTKRIQCNQCGEYVAANVDGRIHVAKCRTYNGWANYETWLVSLWMDNDQGSYDYWREIAAEYRDDDSDDADRARYRLAERLKDEHEEAAHERLGGRADFIMDLINAALSEVAWDDIAEHLFED